MTNPIAYSWANQIQYDANGNPLYSEQKYSKLGKPLKRAYLQKSNHQKIEAFKVDLVRIFNHSIQFKNYTTDAIVETFQDILPESVVNEILDIMNDCADMYNSHSESHDIVVYDIIVNTLTETIDRILDYVWTLEDYTTKFDRRLPVSEYKVNTLKTIMNTLTTKVLFSNEFYAEFLNIIPKVETIYLSDEYDCNHEEGSIFKIHSQTTPYNIRTDLGEIDTLDLRIQTAMLLGVCKHSVSRQLIVKMIVQGAEVEDSCEHTQFVKSKIKELYDMLLNGETSENMMIHKTHGFVIDAETVKDLFNNNVKDKLSSITNKYKGITFAEFRDMVGIGEEVSIRANNILKKYRKVKIQSKRTRN